MFRKVPVARLSSPPCPPTPARERHTRRAACQICSCECWEPQACIQGTVCPFGVSSCAFPSPCQHHNVWRPRAGHRCGNVGVAPVAATHSLLALLLTSVDFAVMCGQASLAASPAPSHQRSARVAIACGAPSGTRSRPQWRTWSRSCLGWSSSRRTCCRTPGGPRLSLAASTSCTSRRPSRWPPRTSRRLCAPRWTAPAACSPPA